MSLIEKISDQAMTLTPSERRLVENVIESPTAAALGTCLLYTSDAADDL